MVLYLEDLKVEGPKVLPSSVYYCKLVESVPVNRIVRHSGLTDRSMILGVSRHHRLSSTVYSAIYDPTTTWKF